MRRVLAVAVAGLLVVGLVPSAAAASAAAALPRNAFTGSFDFVDPGTAAVVGHVTATFNEAVEQEHVTGGLTITWKHGNPRSGTTARTSTATLLQGAFWAADFGDLGHASAGRVYGLLCDHPGQTPCDDFAMVFARPDDHSKPNWVGFSAPSSDWCCGGLWYPVGKGTFALSYVRPTPDPPILQRDGTELTLGGHPFHEISFNAYNLLELWLDGQAQTARDELHALRANGFRVVRVMASPYWYGQFEDVFFDTDPAAQAAKRDAYFAQFDELLAAADANGIRIVADLMWNVENLGALGDHSVLLGMTDRTSPSRKRVEDYMTAVVSRYASRPTIAMWEIGNEWNLGADIQWPQFNYTSDDLAATYAQLAAMIKEIDPVHLVTTGDSAPRAWAMHLLRAVRAGLPVDWSTLDTAADLTEYLALVNPAPIDVVSIHYYDDAMISLGGTLGSPDNLKFFLDRATAMGMPLFVGEIGCTAAVGCLDGGTAALPMLRTTLPVLQTLRLPLTLYWNFDPGVPARAIDWIAEANQAVH